MGNFHPHGEFGPILIILVQNKDGVVCLAPGVWVALVGAVVIRREGVVQKHCAELGGISAGMDGGHPGKKGLAVGTHDLHLHHGHFPAED